MNTFLTDTSPEAEQMQIDLLRQAPPWRRLEVYAELYRAAREMSYLGLRDRFPNDPPQRLERRLADLLLGTSSQKKPMGR
jgi:hypothetical protein